MRWLDEGLFVSDYAPLCHSDGTNTWNGEISMSHKELLVVWYTELQKTKKYLQKLISAGDLILETRDTEYVKELKVITGVSMYRCNKDLDFINQYKEQIDLIIPISNMFLFIQEQASPLKCYRTLDMFIDVAKEFSQLFDIDMTEPYLEYKERFTDQLNLINMSLHVLLDKLPEYLRNHKDWSYLVEIDKNGYIFDIHSGEEVDDIVNQYMDAFKDLN